MRIVEENGNAVVADGVCFTLGALLTQRVEDLYDLHQPSRSLPGNAVAARLELLSDQNLDRSTTHRARTATSSLPTGTPRAIFTRTSASKGLIGAPEPGISRSNFSTDSWRQTNSTAPCVPNVVVPARIIR